MSNIQMICLANSRKKGGRCIAGIDINSKGWIRPVNKGGFELSFKDFKYENGSIPQVLDIVDIPVLEREPLYYQPENWVINPDYYWTKIGELPVDELVYYCEETPVILAGRSDRLPISQLETMKDLDSLTLIRVRDICLEKTWPEYRHTPQLRARFKYNQIAYDLAVTDKSLERLFFNSKVELSDYIYEGNFILTVSLGEPYKGYHYKLVASILCLNDSNTEMIKIEP